MHFAIRARAAFLFVASLCACSSGGDGHTPAEPVSTASIEVRGPIAFLEPGELFTMSARRLDASGQNLGGTVSWSSSNTGVATVNSTGAVAAVAPGSAVISASSDGKKADFSLSVAKIDEETTEDLLAGGTLGFTAARFNTYDVYTVGPGGLKRITTNPANDQLWAWSSDATKIAVVRYGNEGANMISVIANADGSNEVEIAPGAVSWSPDLKHRTDIATGRIVLSNADGSDKVAISPDGASYIRGGWFSPDGSKIAYAFASTTDVTSDIYVVNADGTGTRNVSKTTGMSEDWVTWSPDSRSLAIVGRAPGASTVLSVVNADGTGFVDLVGVTQGLQLSDPHWSPDGTKLVFQMTRAGTLGLSVISASGGLPTPYTPAGMFARSPSWGPDGRIAFSGTLSSAANEDIWVISGDRRKLTRVTTNAATEFNPIWKP